VITLRGHVLLDADEAEYLSRALVLLQQLLRDNRSQPTPRLQTVTAKLTRCAANSSSGGRNGSNGSTSRAPEAKIGHDAGYALLSTGEAARLLDCGERNVRDLAARGRIAARRAGGRWLLDAAAVEQRAQRKQVRREG
jgi:excisionase family DNA binding protein